MLVVTGLDLYISRSVLESNQKPHEKSENTEKAKRLENTHIIWVFSSLYFLTGKKELNYKMIISS